MQKKRGIRQKLVERFVEKMNRASSTHPEVIYDAGNRIHLKRFLKMVESRKKQILDQILMD